MQTIESNAKKRKIEVAWPATGEKGCWWIFETKIFASAFPWLFPGGQGDIKDASEISCKTGIKDVILQGCQVHQGPCLPSSPTIHPAPKFQHLASGFVFPFRQCT
jgi:hypothetical protein